LPGERDGVGAVGSLPLFEKVADVQLDRALVGEIPGERDRTGEHQAWLRGSGCHAANIDLDNVIVSARFALHTDR